MLIPDNDARARVLIVDDDGRSTRSPDTRMLHRLLVLFIVVWLAVPLASAHDGHDHGAPPTPVSTTIAPRFDGSSDIFELIGVLRGGKLTLFIDRFITNEPVTHADVEVETPKGT